MEDNFEQVRPLLDEITRLEAAITPRRLREAVLGDAGRLWLEQVDEAIRGLRGQVRDRVTPGG